MIERYARTLTSAHSVEGLTPRRPVPTSFAHPRRLAIGRDDNGRRGTRYRPQDRDRVSFFLAIPTMFGAAALDLFKGRALLSLHDAAAIGVGLVTSSGGDGCGALARRLGRASWLRGLRMVSHPRRHGGARDPPPGAIGRMRSDQAKATRTAPAPIRATPVHPLTERCSPRNTTPITATRTTLSLSIGATRAASPSLRARK